jgi:GNAT superfamily N-acetyltransferase
MSYAINRAPDASAAYMPIWQPLLAFNQTIADGAEGQPFALTITRPGELEVLGGLWALELWGSFYVALVVVPSEVRGRGFGSDLMRQAEAEARLQQCRLMWLDTYAFQARPFYQRLGFEVFGQLEGPPPIFPRYFMQKKLRE